MHMCKTAPKQFLSPKSSLWFYLYISISYQIKLLAHVSEYTTLSYLFQNPADPLSRSVFVVLGVSGQQLQDSLSAIGEAGKHIGEGTTAVDGKLKFPFILSHSEARDSLLLSVQPSGNRVRG